MHKFASLLAVGLALAGCSSTPPASHAVVSASSADAAAAAALISEYRTAHGLPPVTVDPRLNQAAEIQARAVAGVGTLSHGDFSGRMRGLGIRGRAAENLSAGSRSVDQAIARWKASPGHNDNLLMLQTRRIGLARADSEGSRYERYWALVLAQ